MISLLLVIFSCLDNNVSPNVEFDLEIVLEDGEIDYTKVVEGGGFGVAAIDPSSISIPRNKVILGLKPINFEGQGSEIPDTEISIKISGTATEGQDFTEVSSSLYYEYQYGSGNITELFAFAIIDDQEYEGTESIEIELSYSVNDVIKTISETIYLFDNDFQFELEWKNESGIEDNADIQMSVRRNHWLVFLDLGEAQTVGENYQKFLLSGGANSWKNETGYGCDVKYLNRSGPTGKINFVSRLLLPTGKVLEHSDFFEEDDYLGSDYHKIPLIVFPKVRNSPYELDLEITYGQNKTETITMDFNNSIN
ncbi:hypothetical protein SAMN04488029_0869 [Reichenbachiella faecimaris]|uniref:Calx-beta domain-containing protein n=1 Tax=Reichenbachiella faecimaris TaxID=692418 RepID=A0A1W2G7P4_REIFA|nr:hypothetical protein [Reichenbachiella faecimaris]SMD32524.1 hypothetical protein SAMN04488029_0869 [Reichenbachiella faecimaris]